MAWSPKATDSREAGYIYANRPVSDQPLHLQKRSGPYISRGEVLQHQLVQTQLRNQTFQFAVLLLQFLETSRLIYLQAAVLLPPSEVGLLHDPCIFACLRSCLPVCHRHFDLPQQIHHLLWTMLLSSCHLPPLLFQFVSSQRAQFEPGTPGGECSRMDRTAPHSAALCRGAA